MVVSSRKSRAFDVVYEDDTLIVVDKAAGVLTVPTPKRERFTLVDEISRFLSKSQRITRKAHVVHRLDRETTGLLVFAKNLRMRDALVQAIAADKAERSYCAVVWGVIGKEQGEFRSRLQTNARLDRFSATEGELAVTKYRVQERVVGASVVDVQLVTGRRNQIRIHFAEAGHPVLGDERYRGVGKHRLWDDKYLALHARTLGFVHPLLQKAMRFEAKLPHCFNGFLARARSAPKN